MANNKIIVSLVEGIEQLEKAQKAQSDTPYIALDDNMPVVINAIKAMGYMDKADVSGIVRIVQYGYNRLDILESNQRFLLNEQSKINSQFNDYKKAYIDSAAAQKEDNSTDKSEQNVNKLPSCEHIPNNNLYDDMIFQLTKIQTGNQEILCECPTPYTVNVYDAEDQDKHVGCSKNQCNFGNKDDDFYLHYDGEICYLKEDSY